MWFKHRYWSGEIFSLEQGHVYLESWLEVLLMLDIWLHFVTALCEWIEKQCSFTDASIQRCKLCWVHVQELWNCKWWWSGRNRLAPLACSSSVLFHLFSYVFSSAKIIRCSVQQRSWRKRVPSQSGQPSRHCLVMSQYPTFISPLHYLIYANIPLTLHSSVNREHGRRGPCSRKFLRYVATEGGATLVPLRRPTRKIPTST